MTLCSDLSIGERCVIFGSSIESVANPFLCGLHLVDIAKREEQFVCRILLQGCRISHYLKREDLRRYSAMDGNAPLNTLFNFC